MLQIIQKRKYSYWFSGILIVLSAAALFTWGLRLGIDFKGGTLVEVQFAKDPVPAVAEVRAPLEELGLQSLMVQATDGNGAIIRYFASDDAMNETVIGKLREIDPGLTLLRTDFIGASVSGQIKENAFWGILLSVLGIAA